MSGREAAAPRVYAAGDAVEARCDNAWWEAEVIESATMPIEGGLVTVHEMMRGFIAQQRLKRAGLVVMACWRFQRAARGWPSDEAEDAPEV